MAPTLADKVVIAKGCRLPCRLRVVSSGSFVSVALVERGVVGASSSSCSSGGWLSLGGGSKRGVTGPLWQVPKAASSSRGKGEGQPCSLGLARRCDRLSCL